MILNTRLIYNRGGNEQIEGTRNIGVLKLRTSLGDSSAISFSDNKSNRGLLLLHLFTKILENFTVNRALKSVETVGSTSF